MKAIIKALSATFILLAMAIPCLLFAQTKGQENSGTPSPVATPEVPPATQKENWVPLTITFVGDVNLNRNRVEVLPHGSNVWGAIIPFDDFFKGVPNMINGDINFCNLETVVTSDNNIPHRDKAFCFKMHPNGLRTILKTGFNLFSMANNHSFDYGAAGLFDTVKYLKQLETEYKFHWAGIGKNKEAAILPAVFEVKGVKIGFVSLGIGYAAGRNSPGVGQEIYYKEALGALRDLDVDIRILSCHDGKEGKSFPIDRQLRVYRQAIGLYDVDLVIGHHPHVVQGVEKYKDGLIFYSMGNFMIRGAADMGKRPSGKNVKDFGLYGKLNLKVSPGKGHKFTRLEIIPVYDMHQGPHPFTDPAEAEARISTINDLSTLASLNANYHSRLPRPTAQKPLAFESHNGVGVITFSEK